MDKLTTSDELNNLINTAPILLCFFTSKNFWGSNHLLCKAASMMLKYPNVTSVYIDIDESPKIGAEHSVFICPTILLFTFGKESIRESKFIILNDLEEKIKRYLLLLS